MQAIFVIGMAVGNACISFLSMSLIAQHLSVELFGQFSSALALVMIISPFAGFGVGNAWIKLAREGSTTKTFEYYALKLLLVTIILSICLVNSWAFFAPFETEHRNLLISFSMMLIGQPFFELYISQQQIRSKNISVGVLLFTQNALRLLLLLPMMELFPTLISIYKIAAIYVLVTMVLGLVAFQRLDLARKPQTDKNRDIKPLFTGVFKVYALSWPFALSAGFQLIYYQADIVMLASLLGAESAGLYNTAFMLIGASYILPNALYHRFLQPLIYTWSTNSQRYLRSAHIIGGLSMMLIGFFVMLLIVFFGEMIINKFFGEKYSYSYEILLPLAISIPFTYTAYSLGSILLTQDSLKLKVLLMGFVALFNIVANSFAIPSYGPLGAATTTVLSSILLFLLYFSAAHSRFKC